MRFSLVTVTMGDRPDALARLRDSLDAQSHRDFEHIVVDQREHPEFRSGLSRARNYGLSIARGDVVAFPDDDAWYAPETLSDAAAALADETVDGVSFRVTDGDGTCSAGGWMGLARKAISRRNVWHTVVSCSFFVKRRSIEGVLFDERLGAGSGTCCGSGEDTDFVLEAIGRGARFAYDGTKTIWHPVFRGPWTLRRGWTYGCGTGAVLRKHRYMPFRMAWMAACQGARALQALCGLRFRKALFHLAQAAGRMKGYLAR